MYLLRTPANGNAYQHTLCEGLCESGYVLVRLKNQTDKQNNNWQDRSTSTWASHTSLIQLLVQELCLWLKKHRILNMSPCTSDQPYTHYTVCFTYGPVAARLGWAGAYANFFFQTTLQKSTYCTLATLNSLSTFCVWPRCGSRICSIGKGTEWSLINTTERVTPLRWTLNVTSSCLMLRKLPNIMCQVHTEAITTWSVVPWPYPH